MRRKDHPGSRISTIFLKAQEKELKALDGEKRERTTVALDEK